jgi:hypothetical protein
VINAEPIEAAGSAGAFSVKIAHLGQDGVERTVLMFLEEERGLISRILKEIIALLPDPTTWRLTLTGDIVASVDEIQHRDLTSGYTTNRGAGHVGGVTLPMSDGTFDIVIAVEHLVCPFGDELEFESLVANAIATGRHLGRHEAGHVLLSLRGESAEDYRDLPTLDPMSAGLASAVAAYMEDFRIERHVRDHAPPVFSHLDALGGSLMRIRAGLTGGRPCVPSPRTLHST